MVAVVIPISRLSTKHLNLLFRLDTLRSRSDTTTRNAVSDEAIIVAATIEGNKGVVQTLILVPLDVQIAQLF